MGNAFPGVGIGCRGMTCNPATFIQRQLRNGSGSIVVTQVVGVACGAGIVAL
jgi:hypothetical protein